MELKPCPFCGGRAIFVEVGRPFDEYRVICQGCGVTMSSVKFPGIGEKVAIFKWNTRKGSEDESES